MPPSLHRALGEARGANQKAGCDELASSFFSCIVRQQEGLRRLNDDGEGGVG